MNHPLIDYASMWSATSALVFLLCIQLRTVLAYPKLKCHECIGDDCDGNCEIKTTTTEH